MLGFLGLSGWWFYYFSVRFDWIEDKARVENDPHPSLYMYSRVMGHMTNLFMAFLLLPVTRNSLWEACFGAGGADVSTCASRCTTLFLAPTQGFPSNVLSSTTESSACSVGHPSRATW